MRQGMHFLTQLTALRFGKMSLFAVIGGLGAIANVVIVWALTHAGINYIAAAIIASEVTIIGNFLLIERFVFQDMKRQASGVWTRFAKSFSFNNAELLIRIPIVALMVSGGHISAVIATAITLIVAFIVRFVFHSLVVYAPRKAGAEPSRARHFVEGSTPRRCRRANCSPLSPRRAVRPRVGERVQPSPRRPSDRPPSTTSS